MQRYSLNVQHSAAQHSAQLLRLVYGSMHFKVSEIQAGDLSHAVLSDRVKPKYHRGRMFKGIKDFSSILTDCPFRFCVQPLSGF